MKLRTKTEVVRIEIERGGEKCHFLAEAITPKETTKLIEQSMEVVWDRNQRFPELNLYKYKMSKIKKIIKGWEDDVLDENGNPLPFSAENLETVYLNNPEIIDEVLEKNEAISKAIVSDKEKELKNSKTAQPGTAIQ